jgi:hypothetical protein
MGLQTTRPGGIVRKEDVDDREELPDRASSALNRIVNLYIEFAELQALRAEGDDDARLDRQARRVPHVEKPSRYLGTEVNAVHKDPAAVEVRLALCFPDLYDLGLGNLGIHILYSRAQRLPWAGASGSTRRRPRHGAGCARRRGLPLFALESKDSLDAFDGLGLHAPERADLHQHPQHHRHGGPAAAHRDRARTTR